MNELAEKVEKLPSTMTAEMLIAEKSMFLNVAKFEHAQRVATMLSKSNMVPDHFKNSVGDCLIALNLADRFRADPFMVMQTIYVVHGNPGLEGKLVASLINQSGKYAEPLRYEFSGNGHEPSDEFTNGDHKGDYGCRAIAVDKASGKTVKGPKITWDLVKAEGWYAKKGSKWPTMPELMFMYRAASWFANIHCPEVKLGMKTVEELKDSDAVELTRSVNGTYGVSDEDPEQASADLEAKILKDKEPDKEPEDKKPETVTEKPGAGNSTNGNDDVTDDALRQHELYKTFDPASEEVMGRYHAAKVLKMRDTLDEMGLTWRPSWPGQTLHQKIKNAPQPASEQNGHNSDITVNHKNTGADEASEKEALLSSILEDYDGKQILNMLTALEFSNDMRTLTLDALNHLDNELKKKFGV